MVYEASPALKMLDTHRIHTWPTYRHVLVRIAMGASFGALLKQVDFKVSRSRS